MAHIRRKVVPLLRLFWIALLFYGEIGIYYWHVHQCHWPSRIETQTGTKAAYERVAIVADPQIVDHYSYGQKGALLRLVEFFTDIYIRKSYIVLQQLRAPITAIFLGDLMDGGREWDNAAWKDEYARYKALFTNRNPGTLRVYDMAGNHDIGIGNAVVDKALERFHKYVGPTNQVLHIGGHTVVLLDTLTLESDDPRVSNSSRQLVESLRGNNTTSRLLFTHVPLARPDGTNCGPLRQSRSHALLNRRGYQFRDQLFRNTTSYILDAIQPAAVFSGDDHDTCTIQHQIPSSGKPTTEYTIGAFGWASGVPIASYGLLSLYTDNKGKDPSFELRNCFLPYQLGIYKCYIAAFVASLVLVAVACHRATTHDFDPYTFSDLPGVKRVWRNRIHRLATRQGTAEITASIMHEMTGVAKAQSELKLDGTGIKIGIVDSGVDYNHPELGNCWKTEGCPWQYGEDFVGDKYDPFAEEPIIEPNDTPTDCTNHGTHVSGILMGQGPQVHGVAPKATYGMYRVVSCQVEGEEPAVDDIIVIQGMEAAAADGHDIINISLGAGGWSEDPIAVYASRLVEMGIVVVAAGGNEGDNGLQTIGSPAVGKGVFSVGSVQNWNTTAPKVTFTTPAGDTAMEVAESSQTAYPFAFNETTKLIIPAADDENIYGCNSTDVDYEGAVVVVYRGECSFDEKAMVIQEAGGVGMVVINNDDTGAIQLGTTETTTIPCVGISMADGEKLIADAGEGECSIAVSADEYATYATKAGGQMSFFSSMGPSPDLDITPIIVAPGEDIWSTVPLDMGTYKSQSGTSMAAPYISGAMALLKQARGDLTVDQLRQTIVTTAHPVIDQKTGLPTNPYFNGGGLVDVYAAVQTRIFIDPPFFPINQTTWSKPSESLSEGDAPAEDQDNGVRTAALKLAFANTDTEKGVNVTVTGVAANSMSLYDAEGNYSEDLLATGYTPTWPPSTDPVPMDTMPQVIIQNSQQYVAAGQGFEFKLDIVYPYGLEDSQRYWFGGYITFTMVFDGETETSTSVVPFAGFNGDYSNIDMFTSESIGYPAMFDSEDTMLEPSDEPFTIDPALVPYWFSFSLDVPTAYCFAEFINEQNETVGVIPDSIAMYLPRNTPKITPSYDLPLNTTVLNSEDGSPSTIPPGTYYAKVSILRPFGDMSNRDDYTTLYSSPFTFE
ncbi:hypothetical protein GGF46_004091 [Coemansia sp. RSA 552]|nr:hypothetical protein GGF46_004091 [Coemansia sp. RSA 552]